MHITDNDLKLLIDVLAERLYDELADSSVLDKRESVQMAWAVKDLLENLRQEQRSRRRGADERAGMAKGTAGVEASNVDPGVFETGTPLKGEALAEGIRRRATITSPAYNFSQNAIPPIPNPGAGMQFVSTRALLNQMKRLEKLEALVKEHEKDRMAMRAELGAAQATIGDLLAQSNDRRDQIEGVQKVLRTMAENVGGIMEKVDDHRERLNVLQPDSTLVWKRVNELEQKLDLLRDTMKARSKIRSRVEDGRYKEFKDFQKTVERWSRELKDAVEPRLGEGEKALRVTLRVLDLLEALKGQVEALQLQADDRWVGMQKMDRSLSLKIDELGRELRLHVGEGEVQH